jgi:DNA-directed RNA polymerase
MWPFVIYMVDKKNVICVGSWHLLKFLNLQFAEMKLLMELCKEIRAETVSIVKSKNVTESQPLSGENREGQKPQEQLQDLKPRTEQPQTETIISKSSGSKSLLGVASEKHTGEDGQIPGTYVVGGSAFGWNFITYLDSESVYYGVTKEAFRTSNSAE